MVVFKINLIRFNNSRSSEELLRAANRKFERRFNYVEKELKALEILKWLFDWNIMLDGYKFIFEREGKLDDYKILEDVLLKEVL